MTCQRTEEVLEGNRDAADSLEKAARAILDRAASHHRMKMYKLQDECIRCASIIRDLKMEAAYSNVELVYKAHAENMVSKVFEWAALRNSEAARYFNSSRICDIEELVEFIMANLPANVKGPQQ